MRKSLVRLGQSVFFSAYSISDFLGHIHRRGREGLWYTLPAAVYYLAQPLVVTRSNMINYKVNYEVLC